MSGNKTVEVSMRDDDENEKAKIEISNIGCILELRFSNFYLGGVALLTSLDLKRIFEGIKEAEAKRIDPNQKMIDSLEYIADRIDYHDEDKSRLHVEMQLELPISSSGAVKLEPKFEDIDGDESC